MSRSKESHRIPIIIFLAVWLVVVFHKKGHPGLWHLNPSDYLCAYMPACVRASVGLRIEDLVYHRMLQARDPVLHRILGTAALLQNSRNALTKTKRAIQRHAAMCMRSRILFLGT